MCDYTIHVLQYTTFYVYRVFMYLITSYNHQEFQTFEEQKALTI